jgi:hypothetical protein
MLLSDNGGGSVTGLSVTDSCQWRAVMNQPCNLSKARRWSILLTLEKLISSGSAHRQCVRALNLRHWAFIILLNRSDLIFSELLLFSLSQHIDQFDWLSFSSPVLGSSESSLRRHSAPEA